MLKRYITLIKTELEEIYVSSKTILWVSVRSCLKYMIGSHLLDIFLDAGLIHPSSNYFLIIYLTSFNIFSNYCTYLNPDDCKTSSNF